jgi:uncharacterized membrane protein
MRELLGALSIVMFTAVFALIFFWMGIGAGLYICVDAGDRGYWHKFMEKDTKVLCVIKGKQWA